MKYLFTFATALIFCFQSLAQPLGTRRIDTVGGFADIIHLQNGGYITTGDDGYPLFKVNVTKWDEDFNKIWDFEMPDNDLMQSPNRVIEGENGNLYYMSYHVNGNYLFYKIAPDKSFIWGGSYLVDVNSAYNKLSTSAFANTIENDGFMIGGGRCGIYNAVTRIDTAGQIVWSKQFLLNGHVNAGDGDCTAICPDGDGYVCGFYNIDTALDLNMVLVKLDANGSVMKQKGYFNSTTHNMFVPLKIIRLPQSGNYAVLTTGEKNFSSQAGASMVGSALMILDSNLDVVNYIEINPHFQDYVIKDMVSILNGTEIILTGYINDSVQCKKYHMNFTDQGNLKWSYASDVYNNQSQINYMIYSGNMAVCDDKKIASLSYGPTHGRLIEMLDRDGRGLCGKTSVTTPLEHPVITTTSVSLNVLNSTLYPIVTYGSFPLDTTIPGPVSVLCTDVLWPTSVTNTNGHIAGTLSVYPVPCTDHFYLDGFDREERIASYKIMSLDGHVVLSGTKNDIGNNFKVATTSLSPGIYMVTVQTSTQKSVHRIQVMQ